MDNGNVLLDGIADSADTIEEKKSNGQQWHDKRYSKDKGYSFWLSVNAVRMFPRGTELPQDVPPLYCGYMYRIANMLQNNTNMVVKRYCNYERPAHVEDIAVALGISNRSCYRFLKDMKQKGIIKEQDKLYYVNPIFFICGKYLSWNLYKLFQKDLDHFLPSWVIDRFNGDDRA